MRRLYFVMGLLAIFLQACSGVSFQNMLNLSTNTPAVIATPTVTFTPTITSTATVTPSITPTTTIVHIPTQDPNQPTATFMPIPIFMGGNTTPTAIVTPLIDRPENGFLSVLVSEKKIFWGGCKLNKTKITARVENPEDVYSVVIFVRVKALKREDYTPWTTGDVMFNRGNGSFSYTLVGSNIEGHNDYKESWVFFQLVATNVKGEIVGKTRVFTNSISLSPCM
jgi:hypothetical protein